MSSLDKLEKEAGDVAQEVTEGKIDTKDTKLRYLAFFARIRPIVQPAARYFAYTSDVGEAFRPVVKPAVVTGAYGISWLYVLGDVAYEGYKAHRSLRPPIHHLPSSHGSLPISIPILKDKSDSQFLTSGEKNTFIGLRVAERAVFQATASMLFPALTIHSVVKYSAKALKRSNVQSAFLKAWGPTSLGLLTIPALPFIFDEPVEKVVSTSFGKIEEMVLHEEVRRRLEHHLKVQDIKEKEKELKKKEEL
ncbi:hypothetical protein BT69DRAFT_1320350 [Atractiella rhizophila]|nr:hypothetical protein BT69DRAFT_1251281 [Atractiella rhizophila]KAH8916851.1 hypothetical protein BT69DRAFT_1324037 [Atractiella rhizophila]KAH8922242.1 hypothetical protein BT69DRAFT_1320350 [Atractiella rhizophila]